MQSVQMPSTVIISGAAVKTAAPIEKPPLTLVRKSGFAPDERIDWVESIPFVAVHLVAAIGIFFVKISWPLVLLCVGMYYFRMFFVTAAFHRYFSHRTFKTSRAFQFIMALFGTTTMQKGVLWWAANHRHHHRYSDQDEDIHSPKRGLLWSQMNWILCKKYEPTRFELVRDFVKYPELMFLNKYFLLPPIALAIGLFLVGGWNFLFWGFFLNSVFVWHGTFTINSLAHVWGSRRYNTSDTSRNNFFLAILTMGEGWHNNHHHYMNSARQGFFWWEIDMSYYILKGLSAVGLVWDIREPKLSTDSKS